MRLRRRRTGWSRGPFPVREWVAHRSMWLYYGAVAGAGLDVFVPGYGSVAWIACMVPIGLVGRHTEPLCIQCFKDTPSDPRGAVKQPRYLRWLRFIHTVHPGRRLYWIGLALWIAVVVALSFTLAPFWQHTWLGVPYAAVVYFPIYALNRAVLIHRRFAWFCPLCRGFGRGDDNDVPAPDPEPVPSATKELQPA